MTYTTTVLLLRRHATQKRQQQRGASGSRKGGGDKKQGSPPKKEVVAAVREGKRPMSPICCALAREKKEGKRKERAAKKVEKKDKSALCSFGFYFSFSWERGDGGEEKETRMASRNLALFRYHCDRGGGGNFSTFGAMRLHWKRGDPLSSRLSGPEFPSLLLLRKGEDHRPFCQRRR